MIKNNKSKNKGFTLIELLVVVAIISLLSSVVFSSLSSVRAKARDARRAEDMHSIILALNLYYDKNGCLPTTESSSCPGVGSYSENNYVSGMDYSSEGNFLTFLKTSGIMSNVPVDPKNDMTGNESPNTSYSYRYYCYNWGVNGEGLYLGYWREYNRQYINAIGTPNGVYGVIADNSYTCR